MRKHIVAGNWKMNNTLEEGRKLTSEIVQMMNDEVTDDAIAVLCTPYVHLGDAHGLLKNAKNVFLGAQNCSQHESGAYTGEISTSMLTSVGASYVILGHSERREYFTESDELLAAKVDQVLKHDLIPIFCCGESLDIREKDEQYDFVTQQITNSLFHLSSDDFAKVVIAYEPIWAIGTGKTATSEQAQEMHQKLRNHIAGKYGSEVADSTSILYGGSAKPSNAPELFSQPDVDGGLIGGASLKSRDFIDIIKSF
ncbi:MAG: triose-phosphate isomerase [Cyclobacteriaceae bacterium]